MSVNPSPWQPGVVHSQSPGVSREEALVRDIDYLSNFLVSPHKGYCIDESLKIIKKAGFKWMLLTLFKPFLCLFGSDAFSHVRIYRVAQSILKRCEEHRTYFSRRPELLQRVKREIFDRLNDHTHRKYANKMSELAERLSSLGPSPSEVRKRQAERECSILRAEKQAVLDKLNDIRHFVYNTPELLTIYRKYESEIIDRFVSNERSWDLDPNDVEDLVAILKIEVSNLNYKFDIMKDFLDAHEDLRRCFIEHLSSRERGHRAPTALLELNPSS